MTSKKNLLLHKGFKRNVNSYCITDYQRKSKFEQYVFRSSRDVSKAFQWQGLLISRVSTKEALLFLKTVTQEIGNCLMFNAEKRNECRNQLKPLIC